ncbi:hypothetical protein RUND412_004190 [Rhizina undulata]
MYLSLISIRDVAVNAGYEGGVPISQMSFVSSITLAMVAITVVSFCLARRLVGMTSIRGLPLARYLILAVFTDSWLFVFSSTVLQTSFGLNSSPKACDAGILLCLVCYLSSKFLYMFLVEKVYIIRGNRNRWSDRLFLFNSFGMLLPYCLVIALTFIFRNSAIGDDGQCKIGLKLAGNIPLLCFDLAINIYMTYLFLKPLRGLWSFKNGTGSKQHRLRRVALRTFIGSCITLILTIGNLTTLLILRGKEPGWICFATCNADILFSALCLHWVTHQDHDILDSYRDRDQEPCSKQPTRAISVRYTNDTITQLSPPPNVVTRNRASGYSGFGNDESKYGFNGQVTTNCEALNGKHHRQAAPFGGIMTRTEFTRDVELVHDACLSDPVTQGGGEIFTDCIRDSQV